MLSVVRTSAPAVYPVSVGEVKEHDHGWQAIPLAGFPFPLVARVTAYEPNELVSWEFRGFWKGDDEQMRKVGIIGATLKQSLFGDGNAVGEMLTVKGIDQVRVIGVLEEEEQNVVAAFADFDNSYNNSLFVPASTIERLGGES